MAIRSVVESDLSQQTGASTVSFGLGETWYEVDLTEAERKELEAALSRYVEAGRKAARTAWAAPSTRFVPGTSNEEREAIRTWAKANGFSIAAKGKIPNKIYRAYQEAQGK